MYNNTYYRLKGCYLTCYNKVLGSELFVQVNYTCGDSVKHPESSYDRLPIG